MRRLVLRDEQGSAVAEFVMVLVLVLSIVMAVMQLGFALHVRNTLTSCASEGARVGGRLGSSPGAGAARTRELATATLSAGYADNVSARYGHVRGVEVVIVEVTAPLPVVGPYGPSRSLTVTGRAFSERQ